uniref:Uncharacterized protein n=1 Tax=Onchocerca volvulus TaxID=6282 RepID=A0A8R1TRI2_ONCVO
MDDVSAAATIAILVIVVIVVVVVAACRRRRRRRRRRHERLYSIFPSLRQCVLPVVLRARRHADEQTQTHTHTHAHTHVSCNMQAEHGERRECNTTAAATAAALLPRQQQLRYVDVRCVADTRAHAPPDSITTIFDSIRSGGGATDSSRAREEASVLSFTYYYVLSELSQPVIEANLLIERDRRSIAALSQIEKVGRSFEQMAGTTGIFQSLNVSS